MEKLRERIEEIRLNPAEYEKYKSDWPAYFVEKLKLDAAELNDVKLLRKSIDARKKNIVYNLRFGLYNEQQPGIPPLVFPPLGDELVHIAGFGPAGIFAAISLLQRGIKPIVLERGKAVKERRRDVAKLNREGIIDSESNYCFGEGGAGTFSDGKLYTRSHKRGKIKSILELLVLHGATESILYEAHPHIGTNKLPAIIEALRKTIIDQGGEVRFNSKLTAIRQQDHRLQQIQVNGKWEACKQLILATGHSARNVYHLLKQAGLSLEAKPFAMGFRIEHPQSLIDGIQYHHSRYMDLLPPASYALVDQVNGKGAFSFCMCPGGIIAPAATKSNEVVVNGWSPSKRNGPFANSGYVTEIGPEEWAPFKSEEEFAGLAFQQHIEQKAAQMAGGQLKVPAQNFNDYLHGVKSTTLNDCSYHPGLTSCDLNELYPAPVNERLKGGLLKSIKKLKGFDHDKAIIVAPESRTSSAIRIPRTQEMHHPELQGLYPCGEGAGYAGGILSAALDGVRVAKAVMV